MVANADGSDVRALTEPLVNFGWFKWSPDGSRLALVDHETVRILDVDRTTPPTVLNAPAERMWWRPDGRELVFQGQNPNGLYAIRVDGTGLRTIVANANITGAGAPALSPDGTEIAYTTAFSGGPLVIHIVDVDTGQDRTPLFDGTTGGDGWANWSPDGTRLVFRRLTACGAASCSNQFVVGLATGGPVVETGPTMPGSRNDILYEFSPDGSKIIARFGPDDSTWILDATGGQGERLPAADGPPIRWLPGAAARARGLHERR